MVRMKFNLEKEKCPLEEAILIEDLQDSYDKKELINIIHEEKQVQVAEEKILDRNGKKKRTYYVNSITTYAYLFDLNDGSLTSICSYEGGFTEPEFRYKLSEELFPKDFDLEDLKKAYALLIRVRDYLEDVCGEDKTKKDAPLLLGRIEKIILEASRRNK